MQHRAKHHITNIEDLEEENKHIKKVLTIAGYPAWTWDNPAARKRKDPPSRTQGPVPPLGHVTLPYIQGTSEALARKMKKLG